MQITTDILWDYLSVAKHGETVINCVKRKASFSSVRQHPNKEHVFIEKAIYVVDYEKYPVINAKPDIYEKNTFIFVNDGNDESFHPNECNISCFVIMNASILDIFTEVSDIGVDFNNWAERINDALIRNADLQELVNIGLEFLVNPFIVLDEALNLLAFTDNINAEDETFSATIEKGYTPPTLIAAIMKKRGGNKEAFDKTSVYCDKAIIPYEEVNMPILVDNKVAAVMYVHYSVVPYSEGGQDVLRYFAEKLSYYFLRNPVNGRKNTAANEKTGQFLSYLLRHELDSQEVELMSQAADFPYRARFNMFVLEPYEYVGHRYLLNRIAEEIPAERCFDHESRVIVLSAFIWKNTSVEEHLQNLQSSLERIMKENRCYCGQSREFGTLSELKNAYIQGCAALRIGRRLSEKNSHVNAFEWRNLPADQIFRYRELSLYHMLETCAKELPITSMCEPQVLDMLRYDLERGTDNYKVLYTYLENNRITADAAALLHMHRNNVNYRIKRIEEMFGLNLSDNEQRLRLHMSFRMLDLLELTGEGGIFATEPVSRREPWES